MENIKLNEGFSQVCVWPACIVKDAGDGIEGFVDFMLEKFDVRVQYLEEIKTGPDTKNGVPVPETGNRNDLFFAVHKEDIVKFAVPRLQAGIRWIEDVLAKGNYSTPLYPKRIFDYTCWNEENLASSEGIE